VLSELANDPVRNVARRQPIVVTGDQPVFAVLERMCDDRQGAVLICDEQGILVGIFTERDVLLKLGADETLRERAVEDLMTRSPHSAKAEDNLGTALHQMKEGAFRHLPIVDQQMRPVGILSIRDVLVAVADGFPQEILNLPPVPLRGASPIDGG